jgi:hypothetical protein
MIDKELEKEFKRYHWGENPTHQIETRSKHHSDKMVSYGRLCAIHIADEQFFKSQKPDYMLEIPESNLHDCYLLFDKKKKRKPLMMELDPETQKEFKELYKKSPNKPVSLKEIAKMTGGYQSNRRYPPVKAKPLGYCTHIVYRTIKKSDGLSNYIHEFGEPYKRGEKWSEKPILAVDSSGEIYLCGGNYKSQIEGIVN